MKVQTQIQQETPEEGQRMHRPKCSEYNNKGEDNNLTTLNDKNHQASSKKFRQITRLNSKFSFSCTSYQTKIKHFCLP